MNLEKINNKKTKNIFIYLISIFIAIVYASFQSNISSIRYEALEKTGEFMQKRPISIPYVIFSILILYLLGKVPFFKNIKINNPENKKSKLRDILATIIFGTVLMLLFIGFIVLLIE